MAVTANPIGDERNRSGDASPGTGLDDSIHLQMTWFS
jgi:hypothetical protein